MKLYVVGLGPGGQDKMTGEALSVLERCGTIAGYEGYVAPLRGQYPEKTFLSTPMRSEAARCRMAIEAALAGADVAMVCSGDSGVYGMAGLILDLAQAYPPLEIEVVPGVTAACSGAAVLGAPLMHDFAVISLSDLLTPPEEIEKRLECAGAGDFVVCLYNPASKRRKNHLRRACEILLRYRKPETPAGLVRQIGRDGQEARILTLEGLCSAEADMFTTVFVGNSSTKVIGGKMVTPRGYRL